MGSCFECRHLDRRTQAGLWCIVGDLQISLSMMVSRVSEHNRADFLAKVYCENYEPCTLADAVEIATAEIATAEIATGETAS